jgi:hypothetical protein
VLNCHTDVLVEQWIDSELNDIETQLVNVLLTTDCLDFYRLMIAEGRLAKESLDYFKQSFDRLWKEAVAEKYDDFVRFWSSELLTPYLLYQIDIAAIQALFQNYLSNRPKKS